MSYLRTLLIGGLLVITTGCASGLNSVQKAELDAYEARGLAIQGKEPGHWRRTWTATRRRLVLRA